MKPFKPNLITSALISSGIVFASLPAMAQDADGADAENVEVIQVSGIRGSLMRAQALKMDNTSIVEALSAEDIGKLPDTSVAESLARLPGLAGERRNGRTSGLSVRGFNENYVGTTLNGRELLGMGDNRGVEFDLYPTEIISNILVYKTPEAGMTTQGIGGTIDLQTVKPLSADKTFTINGTYERNSEDSPNPDYDNDGHRLSFNYVDQFADDTLGLALTIASMESPRQEQQFRGWGYDPASQDQAAEGVTVPEGTVRLSGHDSFNRSALLERQSIAGVVQYAPNDKLMLQLDALYIDFEENDVRRGIEEGLFNGVTITGVEDGLVTSAETTGFHSVVRNDARRQDAQLTTIALNVEYQINDDWTVEFDYSTGDVEKTITDVESYSGVGRAGIDGRPESARSWTMTSTGAVFSNHSSIPLVDLTNPDIVRLAGPQGWGGGLAPFQVPNTAQDGFVNEPSFDEELDTVRLSVDGLVEWGIFNGFEAGVVYSERTKSKDNNGAFLTTPDFPGDAPIPNPLGVTNLDFIGINGVLAYDSLALYNSGYYTERDAAQVENDRFGDTYTVEEELTTVYAKLDIDTELGDIPVIGNLGLQVVSADQQSSGFIATTGTDLFTEATPTSGGADYTDVLPSLNLSFEIADSQFIRTALSRVISRPRMDDMRANRSVKFQFNDFNVLTDNIDNSPWTATQGQAELKPLEADQFDLSYENYFADDGYFAVSYFYKDIKNWHRDTSVIGDFTEFYIPGFHQSTDGQPPVLFQGSVTTVIDGLEGSVDGWELQASIPFNLLHQALDGFGMFVSGTFIDGEVDPAPDSTDDRIPGLSEETYSLTFYYEKNGFEFRIAGTKRDDFLTEERGGSLSLVDATDQGGELWDAQIGYDFSESGIEALKGLRVTLQGQNLTDEDTIQTNQGDPRQVTKYSSFGSNYLLTFNYSF